MRRLLTFTFMLVSLVFLMERGDGADPCNECVCKQTKAWRDLATVKTFGLRAPDPNNPKLTIPVEHVPIPAAGKLWALKCDAGKAKGTGNTYDVVQYAVAGSATCQVTVAEGGHVEVTLGANDWDDFAGTLNVTEQKLCED